MHRATFSTILIAALAINLLCFPTSINAEELLLCDDEPTYMTIGFGDHVECQISPATDIDFYEFNGTAGEIIILSVLDLTGGCGGVAGLPCPVAYLYAPSDLLNPILPPVGPGTSTIEYELEESGTYQVRVREAGDNSEESYRIALERLFPASPTALSIWFAEQVDDAIEPVPDQDFYLFDATQDDLVQMTLLDLTGGCGGVAGLPCPYAVIYDPSRTLLGTLGPGNQSKDFQLPETGTYTVYLSEAGQNSNESYRLALECIAGTCLKPRPTCGGKDATIIGTEGDNVIIGTDDDDVIVGLGGNDTIYGLGGKDLICGGDGDDTIYGGDGADRIWGEDGNDVIFGDLGRDVLFGNQGYDSLEGGWDSDKVFGGGGNDTLRGGGGDDLLQGQGGVDVCDGAAHDSGDTADNTCEITVNVELLP